MLELMKGADRAERGDIRVDLMGSIDFLRSQLSCSLCLINIMMLLLCPALADEKKSLDFQIKNLEAMKRQVKGLQSEYERVTNKSESGKNASSGASTIDPMKSEVEQWKLKVDKLIREKCEQQALLEAADKSKAGAEAKVEAMLSQIKGFDKEYDRVLDENKKLQLRLSQVDPNGLGSSTQPINKKDD
ncbi:hypothetical protein CEUSTIGMA_g3388.t1 [Chlamydomonas eustigma]|uniref:Endoplasmic reticulum transmembrane protein n=1 Tax=Chlamydomonas eustigma TaxID=1157962 RepID=A0A250WYT7_9CHLO|nr:hypothetical protein CEUSTIGMA_g3388.t1 [Chlamydomonas eustigma]|eukprot:GAX75945.1 hypothetical protein CEUSTIGMA_g3388.t1 [Chlamydomonas eustigma]